MIRTKIGIKYCGGCNPRYERVEMIDRMQCQIEDRFLFFRHDQQGLDGLITVNGCPRVCAVKDLKQRDVPYRSIAEEGDFDIIVEWLSAFEQK